MLDIRIPSFASKTESRHTRPEKDENTCRIFRIKDKGFIKENFDADLTIVDMKKEQIIKDEMIASKCGWTPFNNYKVKGFPVATIVNGAIVMLEGKIISKAQGQPLDF